MRILTLVLVTCILAVSCNMPSSVKPISLNGETMGTTYNIVYIDSAAVNYKLGVDSVLEVINQNFSTYIPNSTISQFNELTDTNHLFQIDNDFEYVMRTSLYVNEATNGFFDPTVMPLVNYWGFGTNKTPPIVTEIPDSLMEIVGFNKVMLFNSIDDSSDKESYFISKANAGVQLDFSAIAKGYGVDKVANYLTSIGIKNYMVEIGGEVRTKGLNSDKEAWKIGINKPNYKIGDRELKAILKLSDEAIATSGNYINYYEKDGNKYVHTINPKTGMAEMSNLLSVTVVSKYCVEADGFATGFMAMGFEAANKIVEAEKGLEAYFIYIDENGKLVTKYTNGLKDKITELGN